jgi:hypothetical protein
VSLQIVLPGTGIVSVIVALDTVALGVIVTTVTVLVAQDAAVAAPMMMIVAALVIATADRRQPPRLCIRACSLSRIQAPFADYVFARTESRHFVPPLITVVASDQHERSL